MTRILRRSLGVLLALVATGTSAMPASAAFLQNSTGLSNPTKTIAFEEIVFPDTTAITNQYASLGATFAPQLYYSSDGADFYNGFPNISGNYLSNFYPGPENPISIKFNTAVTSAAFAMITYPGTSTFTALYQGVAVETVQASTGLTGTSNYYGFTGILFDEIRVTVDPSTSGQMVMDNLEFNTAPAPPAAVLFAVGLVGLAGYRRLRRKKEEVAAA